MTTRDLLRWQLDLTWALAEYHLAPLTTEDCLFEPAARCWTVHRGPDGRWSPDWADVEPDPVPAPTIGWLTWHVGWWWGAATDHVLGRTPPDRTDVTWPGDAASTVAWLRERHAGWCAALSDVDLDAPCAYPWPADAGLTVAHTAAWVNAELMKNVAEIGSVRLRRGAG